MIHISESFKQIYPDAHIGILTVKNITNQKSNQNLNNEKIKLEKLIKEKYSNHSRESLKEIHEIKVYNDYYKQFKKTYHVQLQLESIIFKGKSIPTVDCIVESMFMAELKNFLLTAVHDYDLLKLPLIADVSQGNENYMLLNNMDQILKKDDMFIKDNNGIISSIVYGPDKRTQVKHDTKNALFVVYAPKGISKECIENHLNDMKNYILLFSPDSIVEKSDIN
jgi:DNA/RNA-binding domain of Phe-tRNA-synthetase-like protein